MNEDEEFEFRARAEAEAAPPQNSGFGSWLKNAALNTGSALVRPAVRAVTAIPFMAQNFGVAATNLASDISDNGFAPAMQKLVQGGQYPYELPSTTLDRALNTYTRAPTTTAGKLSEFANTMIMGATLPAPQPTSGLFQTTSNAYLAPRVAQSTSGLSSAQQAAADAGQEMGMRMTPGQQTGSVALQQFESKLESQPWTSGPFSALKANNQQVVNRAVAGALGENANTVDSTVLSQANDRLGQVFQSVRNPQSIIATNPKTTTAAIDAIDQNAEGLITGSIRDNKLVQNLENLTGQGSINGEQLGQLSSKLGRAAYKQMSGPNGDRDMGQALYAVKDHVDDLLASSLDSAAAATYNAARQQYRNLMLVTSRQGIVNPSIGDVSGSALASKLQQADRSGFLFGNNQSDMYNAARFAQAFKPIVGNSGTATRAWNLADVIPGIPANIAARAYLSGPGSALVARASTSVPSVGISPEALNTFFGIGLPSLHGGYGSGNNQ